MIETWRCSKYTKKKISPFRSVDTAVAKMPLEAMASEPPRSTAIVEISKVN